MIEALMKKNRNILFFLLMLILVPLAGEPKIHPFTGDLSTFRVSFGSPIFLLFLLWLRNIPFVVSGFCVGITVMFFRIFLDLWSGLLPFEISFYLHIPNFVYYFAYAACFHMPKLKIPLYSKALQIAGWSILAEIIASIAELVMTTLINSGDIALNFDIIFKISIIAVLRCLFILSFFFIAQIYQAELKARQEQKEKEHLMLLIASLYEETIQLSKSQQNAETLTRDCYKIYEFLQNPKNTIDRPELAACAIPEGNAVQRLPLEWKPTPRGPSVSLKGLIPRRSTAFVFHKLCPAHNDSFSSRVRVWSRSLTRFTAGGISITALLVQFVSQHSRRPLQ